MEKQSFSLSFLIPYLTQQRCSSEVFGLKEIKQFFAVPQSLTWSNICVCVCAFRSVLSRSVLSWRLHPLLALSFGDVPVRGGPHLLLPLWWESGHQAQRGCYLPGMWDKRWRDWLLNLRIYQIRWNTCGCVSFICLVFIGHHNYYHVGAGSLGRWQELCCPLQL